LVNEYLAERALVLWGDVQLIELFHPVLLVCGGPLDDYLGRESLPVSKLDQRIFDLIDNNRVTLAVEIAIVYFDVLCGNLKFPLVHHLIFLGCGQKIFELVDPCYHGPPFLTVLSILIA
jgi:hypothetical protein